MRTAHRPSARRCLRRRRALRAAAAAAVLWAGSHRRSSAAFAPPTDAPRGPRRRPPAESAAPTPRTSSAASGLPRSPPASSRSEESAAAAAGGEEEGEYVVLGEAPGGSEGVYPTPRRRTGRRIAQLRYVMIRDVEDMIRSSDAADRRRAPGRARENVDRLLRLYRDTGDDGYLPNAAVYNSLMRAHAKSGEADAAGRAEEVLDLMRGDGGGGSADGGGGGGGVGPPPPPPPGVRPDATTYAAVIDAYARSSAGDAPLCAERVLFRMLDEAEGGGGSGSGSSSSSSWSSAVPPTSVACDAVLNAWARRGTREGAERAELILDRMEKLAAPGSDVRPTAYSYATVTSAWARSGGGAGAAERAEALLGRMVTSAAWGGGGGDASGGGGSAAAVRPNVVVFNAVIDAWSRSGDPRAGTKAEELLLRMEDLSRRTGDDGVAPDVVTYNSVINAWSGSGHVNAAKSAERIFLRMTGTDAGIAPTVRTYNSLLKAWARSKLPGSARRVDEILRGMLGSAEAAAAGGGEDDAEEGGAVTPDVVSFSTALDAWAKSGEAGKARRARSILDSMIEFHAKNTDDSARPNAVCYNAVLNACAFSASSPDEGERRDALRVAVSTFNDMREGGYAAPDPVTYCQMLKCVANLVPAGDTRDRMASNLFAACRGGGLVSREVLAELRRAASPGALVGLLGLRDGPRRGKGGPEVSDLPGEWTANVREGPRRRGGAPQHRGPGGRRGRRGGKKRSPKPSKKEDATAERRGEGAPILPMARGLTETAWQSGRDV